MRYLPVLLIQILILPLSAQEPESAKLLLEQTIQAIDEIQTISYRQHMTRSNPRNSAEIINDTREMVLSRLPEDSIVGAKGHWYFLTPDEKGLRYEDIFDGKRLIRLNHNAKAARVYDLTEYPEFLEQPFWSHQTPYTLQYMLRFTLDNLSAYTLTRLKDTLINEQTCFQVQIRLEDKESMPGFMADIQPSPGNVSLLTFFLDPNSHYPLQVNLDNYTRQDPDNKFFTHQRYTDFRFNVAIEARIFDTSEAATEGFEVQMMLPKNKP